MIPILLFESGRIVILIMMIFVAYMVATRVFGIDVIGSLP